MVIFSGFAGIIKENREVVKKKESVVTDSHVTGVEGIEPPLIVLETTVIPLDQTPMINSPDIYTTEV